MAQILLYKGANIDAKDHNNNTPLTYARSIRSQKVAHFLKKNGAKVDIKTKNHKNSI